MQKVFLIKDRITVSWWPSVCHQHQEIRLCTNRTHTTNSPAWSVRELDVRFFVRAFDKCNASLALPMTHRLFEHRPLRACMKKSKKLELFIKKPRSDLLQRRFCFRIETTDLTARIDVQLGISSAFCSDWNLRQTPVVITLEVLPLAHAFTIY